MAFLEELSKEEQMLLVSLPYRAGIWVSRADDDGGLSSRHAEQEALERIIRKKSAGMFESAFVHEIMVETFDRKDDWKKWAEDIDDIETDCIKAAQILAKKMSRHDQDAYRQNVMHIATEVAKAFREFGQKEALPVKIWAFIRIRIDKIIGLFTGQRYESETLLNISYEEDIVLAKLSKALRTGINDVAENAAMVERNREKP